jgi:ankyrin repeat protein
LDRQVKLRGRRVELGEIENILSSIYNTIVYPSTKRIGGKKLIYVDYLDIGKSNTATKKVLVVGSFNSKSSSPTSTASSETKTTASFQPLASWRTTIVKVHCTRLLAPYMVPSFFFERATVPPITRTGKVDVKLISMLLKEAIEEHPPTNNNVINSVQHVHNIQEPMNAVEFALSCTWKEHLGILSRSVGRLDDFFSLGGDSLSALKVMRNFTKRYVINGDALLQNITDSYGNVRHPLSPLIMLKHPVLHEYAALLIAAGVEIQLNDDEKSATTPTAAATVKTIMSDATSTTLNVALRNASEEGDVTSVTALLELGADSNSGVTRDVPGVSPLHLATSKGHFEVVDVLLKYGAKITVCTASHVCPLHIAASRDVAILKRMLKIENESILQMDAQKNAIECSDAMKNACRYMNVIDGRKQNLLHHAARSGNIECTHVICTLLSLQYQLDQQFNAAAAVSQKKGGRKKQKKATTGLDPRDRWQRTPLHWSIVNNHYNVTKYLLQAGALAQPYNNLIKMKNQTSKHTHLPFETPIELATRMYGPKTRFVQLIEQYDTK